MNLETEDETIAILQEALARDENNGLLLRPTPALADLRSKVPDHWFIVRDQNGQRLAEGQPPSVFARIGASLDEIGQARLGWNMADDSSSRPTARMKWIDTQAGRVQILTGSGPQVTPHKILMATSLVISSLILPSLVPLIIATIVVTPVVIRRALAGLSEAAAQARDIDINQLHTRLSADAVPSEAAPLVQAINDALDRLEREYEGQQRFLMAAAHELRTPIAVLQVRLESLAEGAVKDRLLEALNRLANLAGQLLDIQRLSQSAPEFARIDLVDLARRVASDLAPLAIAAGYEPALESDVDEMPIDGDQSSLERALTNLIQNAIQHGGRRGTITITVGSDYSISVTDEGDGVPAERNEDIFKPFHRLHPQRSGAGLGLHLVREIVRRHGGRITVINVPHGGACFRMTFRPPRQSASR
ncbi:HAMP domain-containing sensor histidine kinase [Microvirga terricola]|uniref:sensor histidine kinase n=1 Tax=Microvirga terricola TaxID=2719797 RepID=UPI0031BBB311